MLHDCLERPDRSHLVRAAVAFDFRHVVGGLEIVRPLVEIERLAPEPPRLHPPPGAHGDRLHAADRFFAAA